jgi:hypothetical protein
MSYVSIDQDGIEGVKGSVIGASRGLIFHDVDTEKFKWNPMSCEHYSALNDDEKGWKQLELSRNRFRFGGTQFFDYAKVFLFTATHDSHDTLIMTENYQFHESGGGTLGNYIVTGTNIRLGLKPWGEYLQNNPWAMLFLSVLSRK